MNNDNQQDARGLPFSNSFNFGTTIQNVFRNINHAFANNNDSNPGPQRDDVSQSTEPIGSDTAEVDMPRDDDQDSMPDLNSLSQSSDESEAGDDSQPPQDGQRARVDDEDEPPPLEPVTGSRRARVDDDDAGDGDRDRRHPSERVGRPPQGGQQDTNPPRPPAGLFGALFGFPPAAGGNAPPEHAHTGEGTAGPSPADDNHAPRGVPVLTAGFTFTIPLFGPQAANRMGQTQGGPQGMANMDAATREELMASFAAFFQEFQAMEDAREDPERAKKLVDGLEVVPLGLVKRLERVGGAPGGHAGDVSTGSGCAICWDTLLDAESDSFTGPQFTGPSSSGTTDAVEGQGESHTGSDAMDVDAPSGSVPQSESGTPPSSEPKIISLPCAHVFHASCLLPWFTRAKQATCPTCRFNIDPENLTYTPPPRRAFNRPPRRDNAAPAGPQDASGAPPAPAPAPEPSIDPASPPLPGQPVSPPPNIGFNPFVGIPGVPFLSLPPIQIPLRPPPGQAPEGDNQGIDVLTIGLDMFVGGPPPEDRAGQENVGGDSENRPTGEGDTADGAGNPNPNGFTQDLQTIIEGLLRSTRNIIPQVINAQSGQGPVPAPAPASAPDATPAEGAQPAPAPEAGRPSPVPHAGGPRIVPIFQSMLRPTRPMPPRRERKSWTLPPAPGLSLRQRVEQREREQGLRCSDTSCGVGPSDDDPYPELAASLAKQVRIHPLPGADGLVLDDTGSVCAHAFHPTCLVSAERVAGWGGEEPTAPRVEVSCPMCRAVGCVTREEWELGVSAL